MTRVTEAMLLAKKARREPICVLTCYDAALGRLLDEAQIDVAFVGDSVGTNLLGYESEREVTIEDMSHHLRAVVRGVARAYRLVDMPFMTYDSPSDALACASRFVGEGADAVKLEGHRPNVIEGLSARGIRTWGHLGLTPQWMSERRMQARAAGDAFELVQQAKSLVASGAAAVVLELVPAEVGAAVAEEVSVPVIGIGAGALTDGQVQVMPDVLGLPERAYWHAFHGCPGRARVADAFRAYAAAVRERRFPAETNTRRLAPEELEGFQALRGRQT